MLVDPGRVVMLEPRHPPQRRRAGRCRGVTGVGEGSSSVAGVHLPSRMFISEHVTGRILSPPSPWWAATSSPPPVRRCVRWPARMRVTGRPHFSVPGRRSENKDDRAPRSGQPSGTAVAGGVQPQQPELRRVGYVGSDTPERVPSGGADRAVRTRRLDDRIAKNLRAQTINNEYARKLPSSSTDADVVTAPAIAECSYGGSPSS